MTHHQWAAMAAASPSLVICLIFLIQMAFFRLIDRRESAILRQRIAERDSRQDKMAR